jgi:hypothetical protein
MRALNLDGDLWSGGTLRSCADTYAAFERFPTRSILRDESNRAEKTFSVRIRTNLERELVTSRRAQSRKLRQLQRWED